jgi:hypothetical protein
MCLRLGIDCGVIAFDSELGLFLHINLR